MSWKVLLPKDIREPGKKYLAERGYEIVPGRGKSEQEIIADVPDCDAILVCNDPVTRAVMQAGKKLKVIGRHGIGVDNVDLQAADELGIFVTNAPLSNVNSVAEHTAMLILACAKNLVEVDGRLRSGDYACRQTVVGCELEGKVLGLVGMGRIGTLTAQKMVRGFGMKAIGYDPYLRPGQAPPEIERVDTLEAVFRGSDFVSLHLPATPETQGLIRKRYLSLMKKGACLINSARGSVLSEMDLYEALKDGSIRCAGLDVFEKEPPERGNPLFRLPNCIVTPHSAAMTEEALANMGLHAAIGIDEVLSGKTPTWPVNHPAKN